jgi:murein L,D-transpeptidase YcbB/YkuD
MSISRRGFLSGLGAAGLSVSSTHAQQVEWLQNFDNGSGSALSGAREGEPLLSPRTLEASTEAVQICRRRQVGGGWQSLHVPGTLRIGMRHPSVSLVRQRLVTGGDLDTGMAYGDVFDTYVSNAVRLFQDRHGLNADGVFGPETLTQMNVPVDVRLAQLRTNLPRLEKAVVNASRYVAINVPSATIEAVDNGRVASRHRAVVGQPDRATPLLASAIYEINFNPYWTVPASIIRKDLIPRMREDPNYLTRNRIRVYDRPGGRELDPASIDWSGNEAASYMFRQDPGVENSLGQIRINFANNYQVYLHDTPEKNLFGETQRFHSSGCVRVQNVRGFVAWLLRETEGWDMTHINRMLASGERRDVRLSRAVPVHFVYITAWAGSDGRTNFRHDIYNMDSRSLMPDRSLRTTSQRF